MPHIKKILTILLFALGTAIVPAYAQTTTAETLTLEQAIAKALEANTTVKNAELETEKIGFAQSAYRTRRLPQVKFSAFVAQPLTRLNFTVEKGQFGNFSGTGPIPNEDTKIRSSMTPNALITAQIQQPLSQLYSIGLNIRKFELNKEMAQEQTRQKRQVVVADVKAAYFQIMQTESLLKSARELVTLNREINRVTEQFVQRGVALMPEQMETGTRLSRAEYEVMTLKNSSDSQKEQLNFLLGRDVRTDFNVPLPDAIPTMSETDLAAAQKRALEQRPEIRQAQLKIKQSNLDVKIKKADWIPDVSLAASYTSPFSYSSFLPKNIVMVGVSLEWEVFDWGRKKRELAEKRLSVEQSENSLREAENMVLMEVGAKFRKLREAAEELRITQMSQKTAYANVQVALNKYEQQTILYKDVLQVQTALTDANTKYQIALLSFWTAKAEFEKALGEEK
jgi:outer membrane protein TolC